MPTLVCDFPRSYFIFRVDLRKKRPITVSRPPPFDVNNARMPIEARCRIRFAPTGKTVEYLLGASCKAEQVNVKSGVWHNPNADMCMIASEEYSMVVKSWDRTNKGVKLHPPTLGDQPERQVERNEDAFDSMKIHVHTIGARELSGPDEIVAAGLSGETLVSTTEYTTPDGSVVTLEYPIKVANFSEVDRFYQTDTGPVLWPEPPTGGKGWGDKPISSLRHAFIAHNGPDWAELIVNAPTPLAEGISVNHYSRSVRLDGVTNRVFAVNR